MSFSLKKKKGTAYLLFLISIPLLSLTLFITQVPTSIEDFFLPGSQDGQSGNLEHPSKCDNCHGGYDINAEPAFNWRGSMMAQAARDPLYFATVTIANQDAKDVGDLCIRCHAPDGWLNGRSVPTDGSALNSGDREGVKCDFCHKLVRPTPLGLNPYPGDNDYFINTFDQDQQYLGTLSEIPPGSANGMYVVDANNAKRGPFVDADAKHQMNYSPFHRESALCGTCHDVSNPAFSWNPVEGEYLPNEFAKAAESFDLRTLFPVERTFSEWTASAYNSTPGVYAPQFGGNKDYVSSCQDCHMKDVTGKGANKRGLKTRHDMPLHDMTGGNTFIPGIIAQMYPDEVDKAALDAGVERARAMLKLAATMDVTVDGQNVTVKVTNETGHKLPSGYPEGRRIWINLKAYDASGIVAFESGKYIHETGELIKDENIKVYEIKPGISQKLADILGNPELSAGESFHFVLNNMIYSDNRIPPRGFTNSAFEAIQSPPINYSYEDEQYWDYTYYTIPGNTARVEVTLYYQTTSKEYVEFLRDENYTDNLGNVMYDYWANNGKSAPEVMNNIVVNLSTIAPLADFDYSVDGLTVTLNDESINTPTSWLWDFGDGNSSTEQNPVHSYSEPGTYNITLTVSNGGGTSSPYIESVTLSEITIVEMKSEFQSLLEIIAKGNRASGQAVVLITDLGNNPVSGAFVSAGYTGPASGLSEGTSDSDGIVILSTGSVKNPSADEWCFTINSISKSGYSWTGSNSFSCGKSGTIGDGISKGVSNTPDLLQNYPNPFYNYTNISFSLPGDSDVQLDIYDNQGRLIQRLLERNLKAGVHRVEWQADNRKSGIYYYQLKADNKVITKKMTLLR